MKEVGTTAMGDAIIEKFRALSRDDWRNRR